MLAQFVGAGMEDHDLPDAGGFYLGVPPHHRAQVQMADGAAGEPAELEVDEASGVGDGHGRAVRDGGEGAGTDDGTGVELH